MTQAFEEILKELKNIKRWEGDAYMMFDEVGLAVHQIEVLCRQEIWHQGSLEAQRNA